MADLDYHAGLIHLKIDFDDLPRRFEAEKEGVMAVQ
jgi:hypothetical protein